MHNRFHSKKPRADFAQGRLKTGQMNKTEAEYADRLKLQLIAGEILWYKFGAIKFVITDEKAKKSVTYTPDFIVMDKHNIISIHEVKGHWTDDARVKIKIAAGLFPFSFIAVKKIDKKFGGGWAIEEF